MSDDKKILTDAPRPLPRRDLGLPTASGGTMRLAVDEVVHRLRKVADEAHHLADRGLRVPMAVDWETRVAATLLRRGMRNATRELAEILRGDFDPAEWPGLAAERERLLGLLKNPDGTILVRLRYSVGLSGAALPVASFQKNYLISPAELPPRVRPAAEGDIPEDTVRFGYGDDAVDVHAPGRQEEHDGE